MEIWRLGQRFAELCEELLRESGFQTWTGWRSDGPQAADIFAIGAAGQRVVIDTKVVPANPPTLKELRDMVARSKAVLTEVDKRIRHLAILSCRAERSHVEWLARDFDIEIWDRASIAVAYEGLPKVSNLAIRFETFFGDLAEVERIGNQARRLSEGHGEGFSEAPSGFAEEPEIPLSLGTHDTAPWSRGDELRQQLAEINPGKEDAKTYEALVQEIISYLFGEYLVDPRPQRRTEDELDIMDLVFRVRSGHPFWDTLTRDFRTRAIIFEFKNYSKEITPSQIYSTERYVNVGALRSVCFLVSREKPHDNTELAAFGAMREGGKLFVLLHDEHLIQMLAIRQAQLRQEAERGQASRDFANDPSEILDQVIYEFLTRMGR